MKKVILINKKEGETPLAALGVFRRKHPIYKDLPLTYAGRLDPMASGALLVLAGSECKNKDKYLALDKEYKFTVLFGFSTDTHDILGLVEHYDILQNDKITKDKIEQKLQKFKGKYKQKYPMYSSRTVAGRQLWQYAREGLDVEPPVKDINIKKLALVKLRKINSTALLKNIEKRVGKIQGDFRQSEILDTWRTNLLAQGESSCKFYMADFTISCSSGTYVRSLAHALGVALGIPALAFSIKRTKIGRYKP